MMQRATCLLKSLEIGGKLFKLQARCLANVVKPKVLTKGSNGESIIKSPFGDIEYPEVSIADYIWANLHHYENFTATECGLTGRKYTYANVRDYSNYVGRSLYNIGIKRGDVVAMVIPNLPETPIVVLGCIDAGIILTTVNPAYTAGEISRQLNSSGAVAVITCGEVLDTVKTAIKSTQLKHLPMVIDDNTKPLPDGIIPFKELIERGKSFPKLKRPEYSIDDVAVLPYSSGTTGLPKGVMLTHRNIVSNIEMSKQSSNDLVWEAASEQFQEIIPAILPFFHIYGLTLILLSKLSIGSKLITLPRFTPDTFIQVLDKNQTTGFFLVPPILLFLSTTNMAQKKHIEHIQYAYSGAAPLSGSDVERFYQKFGRSPENLKFYQGYGMTESSPVSHIESTGYKFSSIGKPVAGSECRIVCPVTKKDIESAGQPGELWVRGPHVMKGYLNNEEATKDTIKDGWLSTGDIGYYDEDYDFYITDRLKELIKVKGFQVAPAELEGLLRTHPKVAEAAVVGVPDQKHGEVPKAFVTLKKNEECSAEEIKDFLKGKVSEFKELRGGVQFIENIPKNPTGKILRAALKQQYC